MSLYINYSKVYNVFQTGVTAVAIFTGGMTTTMKCFVAGTLVLTVNGLVAIEAIKQGDIVYAANADTLKVSPRRVLETFVRETSHLVHLTVNGETIVSTFDHPYYVKGKGFVNAADLWIGAELVDKSGNTVPVENLYREDLDSKTTTVYNYKVEDDHTYFVSDFEILVHNADYNQSPEQIIAERTQGYDLEEHPIKQKQLSTSQKTELKQKLNNRTMTKEEYKRWDWNKRFDKRRKAGVRDFWNQEKQRLLNGENGTRNWTTEQKIDIINGTPPKYNGKTIQGHHTYSASKYPQLADKGSVIYPATKTEHLNGWHGGNYKNSLPGKPIKTIIEF